MLKNKNTLLLMGLILILTLFLYGHYVNLFFSQDDFFHLRVSQTNGSLKAFLSLFSFKSFSERGGIYFYRPIFREAIFNIYYRIFGLNPLPFRLTQFLIHFINIILTFLVIRKITGNMTATIMSSLFVAIAAPNIGTLSYLAGGIQISGMLMFSLTSFLFYHKYLEGGKGKYKFISYVFFLLALGSHEMAISIPFINIGMFLQKKDFNLHSILDSLKDNFIFLVTVGVFAVLEIFVIGLPVAEKNYGFTLSLPKIINSYFWYFVWSLGIPEMLVDFVGPGIKLNPNLMKYWGDFFRVIFPSFGILCLLLVITFKKVFKSKQYMFFVFWFIVGIAPVVILPFHRQYYYLEFVLPAVGALVGLSLESLQKKRVVVTLFVGSFLVLTITSIKLAETNYWAISRARLAKSLISQTITKYPSLPKGASLYYKNDLGEPYFNQDWGHSSKQASVILSGSDAMRLYYNDPMLNVYYEDILKPPSSKNIFSIVATIYQ